jgi:hypothetical protein
MRKMWLGMTESRTKTLSGTRNKFRIVRISFFLTNALQLEMIIKVKHDIRPVSY